MKNEWNVESFCGLELFRWKDWDEMDTDSMYFYNVEWLLPSMQEYNGLGVTKNFDGSLQIDSKDGSNAVFDGCLLDIKEFVEFVTNKKK